MTETTLEATVGKEEWNNRDRRYKPGIISQKKTNPNKTPWVVYTRGEYQDYNPGIVSPKDNSKDTKPGVVYDDGPHQDYKPGILPPKDNTKNPKKHMALDEVIGWAFPLFEKYDPVKDARKLIEEDASLRAAGYSAYDQQSVDYIASLLAEQNKQYKYMLTAAKVVDSIDKVTSALALAGMALGVGILSESAKQVIEIGTKGAMIGYIAYAVPGGWKHAGKLLAMETATSLIPGVGDVFDLTTNMYVDEVKDIFAEGAKEKALLHAVPSYKPQRAPAAADYRMQAAA